MDIKTGSCPICNENMDPIFKGLVLGKYEVQYYQCSYCALIQTQEPYWLEEAYSDAIADLDVGLVSRNIRLSSVMRWIIFNWFKKEGTFLDYAGGYGLLVRLMRNYGYNFYRYDKYCQNIFAKHFNCDEINCSQRYELVTAFELFEHLINPIEELNKILSVTDSIIFSTELVPDDSKKIQSWRYLSPESGQHVTFYTSKSLGILADRFSLTYKYDNSLPGEALHLFTRREISNFLFYPEEILQKPLIEYFFAMFRPYTLFSNKKNNSRLKSLVDDDYELIKSILSKR